MALQDGELSETIWEASGPRGEMCIKSLDPKTGEAHYFPVLGYGIPVSEKRFDSLEIFKHLSGNTGVVARLLCLWAVEGPVVEMFEVVPSKDISPDLPGVRVAIGKPDPRGPFPPEEIASALKRAHELCPRIDAHVRDLGELYRDFESMNPHLPHVEISPVHNGLENPYLPRLQYITLNDLLLTAAILLTRFSNEVKQMPHLADFRQARDTRKRAAWFFKRGPIAYALYRLLTEYGEPPARPMAAYSMIGSFESDFLGREIPYGTSGYTETVRQQVGDFERSPRRAQLDAILEKLLSLSWGFRSGCSS